MRQSRLVLSGFLLVGAVAIAVSVVLVHRISATVDEVQARHSPALESILEVRARIGDAVQESFAYVATRDPGEKRDCLRGLGELEELLGRFAGVARIEKTGEEKERELWAKILDLRSELADRAGTLFSQLETTGSIDSAAFRQYEDVIERTFAAVDELSGLEHDELKDIQTAMVREVHQAQGSIWIVAATVVLLASLVGAALRRAFRNAERAKAEERTLRDYFVERSIAVQDSERRRLARELHDETGQSLSALAVGLRGLCEPGDLASVRDSAERLHETAEQLVHSISRLVQGLHPPVIDDHGLVAAIEHLAVAFDSSHDTLVDLNVAGLEELQVASDKALAVYRIVQEALTNVARHADASEVCITLCLRGNELRAMVEDNGCGFSLSETRADGVGLQSMRERAAAVGGKLTLESEPGAGATVVLDLFIDGEVA